MAEQVDGEEERYPPGTDFGDTPASGEYAQSWRMAECATLFRPTLADGMRDPELD